MNVFALEIPCDDKFYGYQTLTIFSSIDNTINHINHTKIGIPKFILNTVTQKMKHTKDTIINDSDHIFCYEATIYNIKEYTINSNKFDDELINDEYICINVNGINHTFKSDDLNEISSRLYYTFKKIINDSTIIDEIYHVEFIEREKSLYLKLNKETNHFNEIN
jgi:hypothetical protein